MLKVSSTNKSTSLWNTLFGNISSVTFENVWSGTPPKVLLTIDFVTVNLGSLKTFILLKVISNIPLNGTNLNMVLLLADPNELSITNEWEPESVILFPKVCKTPFCIVQSNENL